MTELTPTCDIWSVGATPIELFIHSLHYFELFKIFIHKLKESNLFKEFLYQTFCKDASGRNNLQSHKWLINMTQDNNSMYTIATEPTASTVKRKSKKFKQKKK
eukprot:166205_1